MRALNLISLFACTVFLLVGIFTDSFIVVILTIVGIIAALITFIPAIREERNTSSYPTRRTPAATNHHTTNRSRRPKPRHNHQPRPVSSVVHTTEFYMGNLHIRTVDNHSYLFTGVRKEDATRAIRNWKSGGNNILSIPGSSAGLITIDLRQVTEMTFVDDNRDHNRR